MADTNISAITATLLLDSREGSFYTNAKFGLYGYAVLGEPANIQFGDQVLADTQALTLVTYDAIIDAVGPPVAISGTTDVLVIDTFRGTLYTEGQYNTAGDVYNDPTAVPALITFDVAIALTTDTLAIATFDATITSPPQDVTVTALTDTLAIGDGLAVISLTPSARRRFIIIT